ncbi:hypothetical protein [Thalassoglobus polymorphus]|uniref:ABC-2 family transporter protein n=1 Tax=Thalassoglobus polymorphus TaxID=2527994 RepID=A0A517QRL8_9PLAN|nr:hypothetical protein [Thalassoglobus polymorphus]QDT34282.1 ABC-2 family transporter protein [Thalassoglobus polymorphus]
MNIWKTLIWKEFHEQKWKLLSLIGIVLAILIAGLIESEGKDLVGVVAVIYSYVLLAPLYLGMGVSSGEQSSNSIGFVRTLPFSSWKIGLVRVVVGWFVLAIPLLVSMIVLMCAAAVLTRLGLLNPNTLQELFIGRKVSANFSLFLVHMLGLGVCTNLYAWIVAITVNQKSDLRAGLIGIVLIVLLFYVGMVSVSSASAPKSAGLVRLTIFSITPAFYLMLDRFFQQPHLLFAFCIQAGTIITLCAITARRYGGKRVLSLDFLNRFQFVPEQSQSKLGPPIKSARSSLFWMQYRQSIPVVVAGITVVLLLSGMEQMSQERSRFILDQFAPFMGCVLALIIGTGTFVHELEPNLYTFWRSRPISPRRWFWLKYFAGAIVIVGCFDLPMTALHRITTHIPSPELIHPMFRQEYYRELVLYGVSSIFPILLHLFVYSMAALAACSVRHPVYSPILAVCGALAIILGPEAIYSLHPISFLSAWGDVSSGHTGYDPWFALLAGPLILGPFIIGGATLSGWLIKKEISLSPG